jgi:pyridoxamine 5'-phosphate oxidase
MIEHQQMDIAWQTLAQQLHAIAEGASLHLSAENVNRFAELYAAHMEKEETFVTPMATRLFSAAQMEQLGNAMRMRRGIA